MTLKQIDAAMVHTWLERPYTLHTDADGYTLYLNEEKAVHRHLSAVRPCYTAIENILAWEADDLGRPTNVNTLVNQREPQIIPMSEASGVKIHLILHLLGYAHGDARRELIAWRVFRCTREEAAYWLGKCIQPDPVLARWATRGIALMLCGSTSDAHNERDVEHELDLYRKT